MLTEIHDPCRFCYHGSAQTVCFDQLNIFHMDGRRPFGDITNKLYRRIKQLHEEPATLDVDHGIFLIPYFLIKVIITFQLHGCDG